MQILKKEDIDLFYDRGFISKQDYDLIKLSESIGYYVFITHSIPGETRFKEVINIQLHKQTKIK